MLTGVHFAIAVVPLAIYLLLMGGIRLRRRPLVTSGWRDIATLGIAIVGLVAVGPMQLFYPSAAAVRWPGFVWLALLMLYFLSLLLVILSCRPRLIVYSVDEATFRATVLKAASQLDAAAYWSGQILSLPATGLQLAMEGTGTATTQQLVCVGMPQSIDLWLALERAVVAEFRPVVARRNRLIAGLFLLTGGMLLLIGAAGVVAEPAVALREFREFLLR
jgi:hypothetical protein